MDDQHRLSIFQAQTQNVRELERTWRHLNRQINQLILRKDDKGVAIHTKVLLLVYCALAESIFSKLIHTPHGLSLSEIEQVKIESAERGVKFGWLKCVELSIQRVPGSNGSHGPNVRRKLEDLIERFIFDPSLIRNKLPHGQWCVALNRDNTAVNSEITAEIANHDVVELYRRKFALEKLAGVVEDLIESPSKAHHRDYWTHLTEFEDGQSRLAKWTVQKKIDQLFMKRSLSTNKLPS